MGLLLHQQGIAKKGKIIYRIPVTFDKIFQFIGDIIDAQSGFQARSLEGFEGPSATAGDLPIQVKIFFAQALGELLNNGIEIAGGPLVHMFHRIHPEAIDIRIRNPELVDLAEHP